MPLVFQHKRPGRKSSTRARKRSKPLSSMDSIHPILRCPRADATEGTPPPISLSGRLDDLASKPCWRHHWDRHKFPVYGLNNSFLSRSRWRLPPDLLANCKCFRHYNFLQRFLSDLVITQARQTTTPARGGASCRCCLKFLTLETKRSHLWAASRGETSGKNELSRDGKSHHESC